MFRGDATEESDHQAASLTELRLCNVAMFTELLASRPPPDNGTWWEADLQRRQRVQRQVLGGRTHGRHLQVLLQQQDVHHDPQDRHVHHRHRRGPQGPGHGDRRYTHTHMEVVCSPHTCSFPIQITQSKQVCLTPVVVSHCGNSSPPHRWRQLGW